VVEDLAREPKHVGRLVGERGALRSWFGVAGSRQTHPTFGDTGAAGEPQQTAALGGAIGKNSNSIIPPWKKLPT